jgi:hypothetical protein
MAARTGYGDVLLAQEDGPGGLAAYRRGVGRPRYGSMIRSTSMNDPRTLVSALRVRRARCRRSALQREPALLVPRNKCVRLPRDRRLEVDWAVEASTT